MTSVDWLEIDVSGGLDQLPFLEVALIDLGFPGWVDLSTDEEGCYRVYLARAGGWEARLQRLMEEARLLGLNVGPGREVRDEDWAENWKKFYHPLPVGNSLVICPSWEAFQAEPGQKVIILDPGSAFGTGYHPTTQLCLELIESVLAEGGRARVLDLGTGSGILAIAAWLLGARRIWAADDDPVAVKVAGENFAINGIPVLSPQDSSTDGVRLTLALPEGQYDLIVANLIATTLVELAPRLAEALAASGELIVGGVIDTRRDDVHQALLGQGLTWIESRRREDWYSLRFRRP